MKKNTLFTFALLSTITFSANSATTCESDAIKRAEQLLSFHVNGDDRVAVSGSVNSIKKVQNPGNPDKLLNEIHVSGYVYKSEYDIALSYYPIEETCILVGESIIELVTL